MKSLFLMACLVTPLLAADWRLVWSDEFDGQGRPDAAKWSYETGFVRNREAQYYTRARPENARIEVRAKLPTGRGTWPAIWLLGANHRTAGWPRCGEIDVMENVGFDPDIIHAKKTGKGDIAVPRPYDDFHVYAVEWSAGRMDFSVDGKRYFSYENEKSGEDAWPYDQPFYLILNIAIGGAWGGQKGVDDAIFPQRTEVDYVRVYRKAE